MRCPKCGFISFDYLENCLKCQADLTEERGLLNLPGIKPKPFSILEIAEQARLTGERDTAREKEKTRVKTSTPTVQELPELDLTDELELSLKEAFPSDAELIPPKGKEFNEDDPAMELFLEDPSTTKVSR